jgi:hypothetical protein
MVVFQQSTESFATLHRAVVVGAKARRRKEQYVVFALMRVAGKMMFMPSSA